MRHRSDYIYQASLTFSSNIWLHESEGKRYLIDTGHWIDRPGLRSGFKRRGIDSLDGVILTHRHSDHAANAAWLREKFGCPVCCHENDAVYLSGEKTPPKLKRGIGNPMDELLCGMEDKHPAGCHVDEAFGLGTWKDGFYIYDAFGHTQGSVIIYHEPTRILFTGDALLTGYPVASFWEHFYLAVPAYSNDVQGCHKSVKALLKDPPDVDQICAGHGPFVGMNAQVKLKKFYESVKD